MNENIVPKLRLRVSSHRHTWQHRKQVNTELEICNFQLHFEITNYQL